MELERLTLKLSICKVSSIEGINLEADFFFIARTHDEISIVCETARVPENVLERQDGWNAFRIKGMLDFSLVGILAKISAVLADASIGIFAVSTYNTDYILVKEYDFDRAATALISNGYAIG